MKAKLLPVVSPPTQVLIMGHDAPASNQRASKDKRDLALHAVAGTESPEILAQQWMQKVVLPPASSSSRNDKTLETLPIQLPSSPPSSSYLVETTDLGAGARTASSRVQVVYVMNKARDLCARLRQQSKIKAREERKRILLKRQIARDVAREAAQAAQQKDATDNAFRRKQLEEQAVQAMFRAREVAEQQHEMALLRLSEEHYQRKSLLMVFLPWRQRASNTIARRLRESTDEAHTYHQQFLVRSALRAWQGVVQDQKVAQQRALHLLYVAEQVRARNVCRQGLWAWKVWADETHVRGKAFAHHLHLLSLRRCFQRWRARSQQDQQLRTGILLWDCWMKHRAFLIWRIKAQYMSRLLLEREEQEKENKTMEGTSSSSSSSLSWAIGAQKWLRKEVARVVAPPPAPRSPSYYLDEV